MLVLADRNFDATTIMTGIAATGADVLMRGKTRRAPPSLGPPPGRVLHQQNRGPHSPRHRRERRDHDVDRPSSQSLPTDHDAVGCLPISRPPTR